MARQPALTTRLVRSCALRRLCWRASLGLVLGVLLFFLTPALVLLGAVPASCSDAMDLTRVSGGAYVPNSRSRPTPSDYRGGGRGGEGGGGGGGEEGGGGGGRGGGGGGGGGGQAQFSVFWTVGTGVSIRRVVREQLVRLERAGILDRAASVQVAAHDFGTDWRAKLLDGLDPTGKVTPVVLKDPDGWSPYSHAYEFVALEGLHEHCLRPENADGAVLYLHTKGSTAQSRTNRPYLDASDEEGPDPWCVPVRATWWVFLGRLVSLRVLPLP